MNFKYCPKCSKPLGSTDKTEYQECSSCGYINYKNPKPVICAVITNDKGEALLTKRGSGVVRSGGWALVGGFIEPWELPEDALKREVKEEIGVDVELVEFLGFYLAENLYAQKECLLGIAYHCRVESGIPEPLHETVEVGWFAKDDIPWDKLVFPENVKTLKAFFK